MPKPNALPPEDLSHVCALDAFTFNTTSELPTLDEIIGQGRALKAIEFGLGITNHNYNIFVLGEGGTGKETTVKGIIEAKALSETVPDDLCCVFNFVDPDMPRALCLPPGKGSELTSDMAEMVDSLRRDIPKVFESKDYEKHRDEIVDGQQERTRAIFFRLEQKAVERGLLVKKSASGLSVAPAKDGKAMTPDEFDALPKGRREVLEEAIKVTQEKLSDAIREARGIEKETKDRITTLDREVVQYVVNPLINEMTERFNAFPAVLDYLGQVKENILNSIDDFRPKEEMPIAIGPIKLPRSEASFERYSVNLMVNNAQTKGAPVVFETNPTYYNLFGRIEYRVQFGVASTDFTMIKAGAVHKANGGYLIVNAIDVLRNIFVYDSLKRMIKNRELRMEDVWEQYRLVSSTTLKPAPIPVNIKLVLLGEPFLYYLLYNLDREYRKLFKVKADFESVCPMTPENVNLYALFIAARCREEGLKPFDRSGVGRIVEHGLRLSGDKERLSVRFNEIEDLVVESSYWAGALGSAVVTEAHVEKACSERVLRNSKIEDKLRDYIIEDTLMVAVDGAVVGQINGMAVLDPGDRAFGKPSRITARVYMGDAGIVNVEREVKMSGRIHNKALLILTGFLGERFAGNFPLTLSASVCFEQLYDEVEGDSATCTEVYALLSSIAGVPIDQGMAVTGSMNQLGEVQPIGGVNEKIEGFFDVCKAKGLTGKQGVIIPRRNVRNLMLKKEVIEAVKAGRFAVYPIDRVDEGLEILTGMTAGERLEDGSYPAGTINRLVQDRLLSLAKRHKEFGRPPGEKKGKPEENKAIHE
ncbi:MAG: AAA family ATPase [Deltaproteobacteria bacterium]|nr:AAA family ATPase [Deltaproteobacteria bacterium]